MDVEQQAQTWLNQQGLDSCILTPLAGYTNHVFRVESVQQPKRSVIRLGNHALAAGLCPLAQYPKHVIRLHQDAVDLDLAPELLGFDDQLGLMWLADVGERRTIQMHDFAEIQTLLTRLHHSDLAWRSPTQTQLDGTNLLMVQRLATSANPRLNQTAQQLLKLATQRGYAHYPVKPIHSDLNPGNWLHDGQRWWLIDWDYARLMVAEWDYASLIVEHAWDQTQAQAFAPSMLLADLAWFCACFALLSWDWHVQRGTQELATKQAITAYWLQLCDSGR